MRSKIAQIALYIILGVSQSELALFVGMNTEGLIKAKETHPFLSAEQMRKVIEQAGFKLKDVSRGYAGVVNRYVFRKPVK